jgi:hypothetical protein
MKQEGARGSSILIGVLCNYDVVYKKYAVSLLQTVLYLARNGPQLNINQFDVLWTSSAYIWDMRNKLSKECVEGGYDYLFMTDVDMAFPPNALAVAIETQRRHGYDIVGIPYMMRNKSRYHVYEYRSEYCWRPLAEINGPMEVDAVGTGLMLISRKVFEEMNYPWFEGYWRDDVVGEDMIFCKKAKDLGFKIGITQTMPEVDHLEVK